MRVFQKLIVMGVLCVGFSATKVPVKNSVKLVSHKNRSVYFNIKKQQLEWVNGKLNLSLLSADNKLLQLNNIDENWLKDTTFRHISVSYVLIDSNKTFTQHNRILPLIEIECKEAKPGAPIFLRAHGRVYYNKIWYTATFNYSGKLPNKTHVQN
jgi:ribonuclease HII